MLFFIDFPNFCHIWWFFKVSQHLWHAPLWKIIKYGKTLLINIASRTRNLNLGYYLADSSLVSTPPNSDWIESIVERKCHPVSYCLKISFMIHRGQDRRQCMMGMSESGERTIYSFVKSISRKNIFDTHFKTSTTYHIFVTIKFPFQFSKNNFISTWNWNQLLPQNIFLRHKKMYVVHCHFF